ncbi:MAG: hypothetical protein OHK0026_12550 [Rhodocyclaceae bacterium]
MAKRISLRQFQESLVSRLAEARSGEAPRGLLGVQAGNEFWLTELADAGEIVPAPPITPVPLAKPWLRGLANIRGNLCLVVDFAAFGGGGPTALTVEARLLLPNARYGSSCALLVSRALGLRNPEAFENEDLPGQQCAWVAGGLVDSQGRRWKKLAFGPLLADAQFLDVGC